MTRRSPVEVIGVPGPGRCRYVTLIQKGRLFTLNAGEEVSQDSGSTMYPLVPDRTHVTVQLKVNVPRLVPKLNQWF